VNSGLPELVERQIAGIKTFYSHAKFWAGSELTGLESNRDE